MLTVLGAIADSCKFSTSQHLTRKPGRKDKEILGLKNSLLSPNSPAYKAALGLLTDALEGDVAVAKAKSQKRLHGAIVS